MRARVPMPPTLCALARVQGGVLSRQQLISGGLSRRIIERMLSSELLTAFAPGLYTRGGDPGWMGRVWAGQLLGGPQAVIGLEAAGHLHGLIHPEPGEVAVYSPLRIAPRQGWVFIRSTRSGAGEPCRTGVEATVIDLCATRDEDGTAALLADAISSRRTTAHLLRAELSSRRRLPNQALLREILGDVAEGAHSALERRYQVHVERAHGLPTATRQAHASGLHRSDGWYSDHAVLVELDSKLHHSGGSAFADMVRDNDHAAAGIITLRFGWSQVTGVAQCETARFVGQLLMKRGWEGPIRPCSRCRLVHAV